MNKYDTIVDIPAASYIYRVKHRIMEGDCQYDHGPRMVKVPHLRMSKYPVTNGQYYEFIKATGYIPPDDHNFLIHWENGKPREDQVTLPVVWVCRNDAKAYAAWKGGRLPKDHEWQYAASGNEKLKYPWGNEFREDMCSCGEQLRPVDDFEKAASPLGIVDMCGNAFEWVDEIIDDGMHLFTFLRGGSYFHCDHFWHADGGPRPNDYHLKFQLLNDGHNRCGTTTFRCVWEVEE